MATVVVGSKLPNGLILTHPLDPTIKVTIGGLNSAPKGSNGARMIVPYVTTEIDADFWAAWFMAHNHDKNPFGPLESGAIFVAKNEQDAKAIARDLEGKQTGLEPVNPNSLGVSPA